LRELGVLPDFHYDVDTGAAIEPGLFYRLQANAGFFRANAGTVGAMPGQHILSCRELLFDRKEARQVAKYIARKLIDWQLQGRTLNSRNMIRKLMEHRHA
jgi:recombinational DNA repair protein (RecF pathway)